MSKNHRYLWIIVGLFLILGSLYSIINPILESPDEKLYYEDIRFIIDEHRLPTLELGDQSKGHHPPLFFVLGAVLVSRLSNENFDAIANNVNPYWGWRHWEPGVDNKSIYAHDPILDEWPYRDAVLAIHLLRLLSLAMGAAVVVFIYLTAQELFPTERFIAPAAAAVVAFNPMFVYIQSSVHNDALANLWAALTIYGVVRFWHQGPSLRQAALLGLLCGLGIMTKITFLALVPMVVLALAVRCWLDRHSNPAWGRQLVQMILVLSGLIALVSGWWFLRNQLIYGEPTSMQRQMEVWGVRENSPDIQAALRELGFLRNSFWGVFGYGQVHMPEWIYSVLWVFVLIAFGGLLLWFIRLWRAKWSYRTDPILLAVLLVAPLTVFVITFARMTVSGSADFGRYLFLSLGVIVPALVFGSTEWLAYKWRPFYLKVLSASFLTLSIWALVAILRPAYYLPVAMLPADNPDSSTTVAGLRLGEFAVLTKVELADSVLVPGEDALVKVEWLTLDTSDTPLTFFVKLIGPDGEVVGQRHSYPGLGRTSTTFWQTRTTFADLYRIPVDSEVANTIAPAGVGIYVGLYDASAGVTLPVSDNLSGQPIEDPVIMAKLPPLSNAVTGNKAPVQVLATIDGKIQLNAVEMPTVANPGVSIPIDLHWTVLEPLSCDCKLFVHLVREDDVTPLAQKDEPIMSGRYPSYLWESAEQLEDRHWLELPQSLQPGSYLLVMGLYRDEPGWPRLQIQDESDSIQRDSYVLGRLQVE